MNELHVLHQHFSTHAELVTDRAAAWVGSPNQRLVLLKLVNISIRVSQRLGVINLASKVQKIREI